MQVLGCESGLALNEEGQPVCSSGWVSVDPNVYQPEPLSPEDAAELWGWAVLCLVTAAACRLIKNQLLFG